MVCQDASQAMDATKRGASAAVSSTHNEEAISMIERLKDAWRDLTTAAPVPAYILVRADSARTCPECGSGYAVRDRYCPGCHVAVPEWRFG